MHFLVEHQTTDDVRIALCETLADVHLIAEDLIGDGEGADSLFDGLGLLPEGELHGDWGVLRYAPAA